MSEPKLRSIEVLLDKLRELTSTERMLEICSRVSELHTKVRYTSAPATYLALHLLVEVLEQQHKTALVVWEGDDE